MSDDDIKPEPAQDRKRIFGAMRGEIEVAEDFDNPLPEALLNAFEGKDDEIMVATVKENIELQQRHTLELLLQSVTTHSLSFEDREWLNAPDVGREQLDDE